MHVWPIKIENVFDSKTYEGCTLAINVNESCQINFSIELWDNLQKSDKNYLFFFLSLYSARSIIITVAIM